MTSLQRIRKVLKGLLMLLGAAFLLLIPDKGYLIIGLILSVVLILDGIRSLWFYFTMARNMVGGKMILFRGIIGLDLGVFAYTLKEIPPVYILLYLLIANLFSGVVDVLRAMEAKRMESRWRLSFVTGAFNILLAVACGFCFRDPTVLTYVYSAGLVTSALLCIAQAFRKTAIVYIP